MHPGKRVVNFGTGHGCVDNANFGPLAPTHAIIKLLKIEIAAS